MKIICRQENLIKGLLKVSHLTGKNFNLPILNNILIKAEKGKIELLATNLEMAIKTTVRGRVEVEGRITIPARVITDYINLIDMEKNIELEVMNDDLVVSSEGWQTKIKANVADDYPLIPEVKEEENLEVKIVDFKKALNQTLFAASFDEARPELTGVLFWINEDQITLTTTDSYRLAEKKIGIEKQKNKNRKSIVPLKTMQELVRIVNDEEDGILKMFLEENQIKFYFNETQVISRLIEGEYPDYKQIVPEQFNVQIEVETEELIKAIKASSLFTKTGIFDVNLNFSQDKLLIKAVNAQIGENKIELKINGFTGDDFNVVFNYKYLLDGLGVLMRGKTTILINSASNPVIFKSSNDDDYIYLVMPIRQ